MLGRIGILFGVVEDLLHAASFLGVSLCLHSVDIDRRSVGQHHLEEGIDAVTQENPQVLGQYPRALDLGSG